MAKTRPPSEKKLSEILPVHGNICWNNPLFCMNKIHPMEEIYGGVINGIMRTISSHFQRENLVLARRNARGVEIIVETITTRNPKSIEFVIVVTLSLSAIVCNALLKSKRPSTMTASLKTAIIGRITNANNTTKIVKYTSVRFLPVDLPTSCHTSLLTQFI